MGKSRNIKMKMSKGIRTECIHAVLNGRQNFLPQRSRHPKVLAENIVDGETPKISLR